jgi:ATP-dependent Clp protease ATP-binding subunit ClpC
VEIVDLMLARLVKQLAAQGIGFEMTGAAKLLLADRGYDPTMGARPLRRALQQLVEDPLSEKLLFREFGAGQTVVVDAVQDPETGDEVIVFVKQDGYEPPALNEDPVPLTL